MERLLDRIWYRDGGCWEWQGYVCPKGYGKCTPVVGAGTQAHRAVYVLLVGPIPDGLHLDHLCRNRACVNPLHLEPVSAQENASRGLGKLTGGSAQRAKTHCPSGHGYTPENTRKHTKRPGRFCKVCHAAAGVRQRGGL